MRKVAVEQAVGLALGHDITEIDPVRGLKRRAFRRGQVITAADVERLRDLGKETVFVGEIPAGQVHEDDAARAVAPLAAGANVEHDAEPSEGKVTFRAACAGLFRVDVARLLAINELGVPSLPTITDRSPVAAGQAVAAFRIIPLTCDRVLLDRVRNLLAEPLLRVLPFRLRSAGIVVTGNEVHAGRIRDGFVPRLTAILAPYGVAVTETAVLPDERAAIAAEIVRQAAACDLVLVTGGTSVDPDDVTVLAMADAGVACEVRGMPVQPGNNFTVGYLGAAPVCAVPAAALIFQATALDLFLPRLLAGERVTARQIHAMGHGGLCLACPNCHFPACGFGKGTGA